MAQFNPYQASIPTPPATGSSRQAWTDWLKGLFTFPTPPVTGSGPGNRIPTNIPVLSSLEQFKIPSSGIAYPGGTVQGLPHGNPVGIIPGVSSAPSATPKPVNATVQGIISQFSHPNIPQFGH
jgi:hypothetical protein